MKNLITYITEKFKITKDTISFTKDSLEKSLEGTKVLLCKLYDSSNDGKNSFFLEEIEKVDENYVILKNRKPKYDKNSNWKGRGGWQAKYADMGSPPRNQEHIILPKEGIKVLEDFIKYGDRASYCGGNYGISKEAAEELIKELNEELEKNDEIYKYIYNRKV